MKKMLMINAFMLSVAISALDINPAGWFPEGRDRSPARCEAKTIELDGKETSVLNVTMVRREKFWGDIRTNLKEPDITATPVLTLRFKASAETKEFDLPLPNIRAIDKKGTRVLAPKDIFKTNENGWIYVTWDISATGKLNLAEMARIELLWQYGRIPEGKTAEFQLAEVKLSGKEQ